MLKLHGFRGYITMAMVGGNMMNNEEVVAKKSLGQHWLTDPVTLEAICDLADIASGDTVLEIGPGRGSLTERLLMRSAHVQAVEVDRDLIAGLRKRFGDTSLEIINQDIRRFDFRKLPSGYKIVANIPYYLTNYLIQLLTDSINPPAVAVLLIQREVADRLMAKPGQLSILAVITQAYWTVTAGPVVPAAMFTPPPKVDSQIVKMVRRSQPLVPPASKRVFIQLVRICFGQKRKTLANSLSAGYRLDKDTVKQLLEGSAIPSFSRPQQLNMPQWLQLTKKLSDVLK